MDEPERGDKMTDIISRLASWRMHRSGVVSFEDAVQLCADAEAEITALRQRVAALENNEERIALLGFEAGTKDAKPMEAQT